MSNWMGITGAEPGNVLLNVAKENKDGVVM
jgi:hypothetical protein